MTERARQERRRQARRRQVRRRRAGALVIFAASALLLVSLIGTQVPAEATSTSTSAAEGTDKVTVKTPPEKCDEGEVEREVEIEGEPRIECEPEAEPKEEAAEEETAEHAEEGAAPEEAPPAVPPPAPQAPAAPSVSPTPEQGTHQGGHSAGTTAGSSIKAPTRHHNGDSESQQQPNGASSPSPSHASHPRHHGHSSAPKGSGGTAAETSPSQPHNWGWSGPWSIPWQIVACESGGNYGALNPSSGAGGAYQIIPSTWSAYGGTGEPQKAPPAEQDRIASEIWADSGPSAWVCAQEGNWIGARLGSLGTLPDPLPPARRLDPAFVSLLTETARATHVNWALLLAIVRLRGGRGPSPANATELRRIAHQASSLGRGPLGKRARLLFAGHQAQRLVALTYYDRAVGRRGLVKGLEAVKRRLERRVLRSRRLQIYSGGREDVAAGRVDVRVLTLLLYLAQRYHSVTVSCLVTGHSLLTSSGRPSLHPLGRAVDISALNEIPILGHQQPGGITEHALRQILLLPREMQPSELISLFELGGPSFALADHADHIHVGF